MFTRRHALIGTGALLGTAMLPLPARALSETQARSLVDKLIGEINAVIASGKSEAGMIRDFERIFQRYADTAAIAAYALGVDGRRASRSQKSAFSKAFNAYVARKYGKRFRQFIGGRLEVQRVKPVRNFVEVSTTAFLRGQAPFEVAFHVSDRTGKDLFFNMFIEGVNMLLTERTEVGAMLDRRRGDIDAMIEDLKRSG
ncbi:MAG: ABC transporter substrate-binding protein [Paracoccaceae bacterium]|nr:ABC transporter substrate-binding protein [Paracoccaceae bacterium]